MSILHRLPIALLLSALLALGLALLAFRLAPAAQGEPAATVAGHTGDGGLEIEIIGIRHDRGRILIMIYDDPAAWARYDEQQLVAYSEMDAVEGRLQLAFDALTQGPYAIALWHDEDGDGELAMSGAYPLEGYGTSGARDRYDEVPFQRAAVAPGAVTIHMYYPQE